MKASDILQLLGTRHRADTFVAECKDGPTIYGDHSRMDAWVMRSSWRRLGYIGYEIKVSRSDFVQDHKWPDYLPLCNEFYFVCPAKLIAVEECPPDAGLMWAASTGTRLYTKKKAPWRDIEPPVRVLQYVLMCRASIGPDKELKSEDNVEHWKAWLAAKRESRALGHRVSQELAAQYRRDVERVEEENRRLKAGLESLTEVRELCKKHKIPLDRWSAHTRERRVRELDRVIPQRLVNDIRGLSRSLTSVVEQMEGLKEEEVGHGP